MTSRCVWILIFTAAASKYSPVCGTAKANEDLTNSDVQKLMGGNWNSAKVVSDTLDCVRKLSGMQFKAHAEVKATRTGIATDLIGAINAQYGEFNTKKMEIISQATELKNEASGLETKLKNAKNKFMGETETLTSGIAGVQAAEKEQVDTERELMVAYFAALKKDVKKLKESVVGVKNPVMALVAAREAGAKAQLEGLGKKVGDMETASTEKAAELGAEVTSDSSAIQQKIDSFNQLMGQSENTLSGLKDSVDDQVGVTATLQESLDNEIEKRKASLTAVSEDATLKDEQLKDELSGNQLKVAAQTYETYANNARDKADQYNKDLNDMTSKLETDSAEKIRLLNEKKIRLGSDLETKLASSDEAIDKLTTELVAEADLEKAFPKHAENELAKLEATAQDSFNEVRTNSMNFFKSLNQNFQTKAKSMSDDAITELDNAVAAHVDADKLAADAAEKTAQTASREAVDDLVEKKTQLAAVQEQISGMNELASGIDSRVKRLDTQVKRTSETIDAQMDANKRKIELDAKKVGVTATKELNKLQKKTAKAHKAASKTMARAEKELRVEFEGTTKKLARKLKQQLTRTSAEAQKVTDLGKRMGDKMKLKTDDIERKINVVTNAVPKINADVTQFRTAADQGIIQMEGEADTAMSGADAVVANYLESLRGAATLAIQNTQNAVKPLEEANQQRLTTSKAEFQKGLAEIRKMRKSYVDSAKDEVLEAEEKVRQNTDTIDLMPQNINDAYHTAQASAAKASEDLHTALDGQVSQLLSLQKSLGGDVENAEEQVTSRADQGMKDTDKNLADAVQRTAMEVNKHLQTLREVENQGTDLDRKTGTLDRHAQILHGMLKEAKTRAENAKQTIGKEVSLLDTKVQAQEAAAAEAEAETTHHLDKVGAAANANGNTAVSEAAKSIGSAEAAAKKDVADSESAAGDAVSQGAAEGTASIKKFEGSSAAEVNSAGDAVSKLEHAVVDEKKQERRTESEITAEGERIKNVLSEKSDAFEKEMMELGAALKNAVGGDAVKMDALLTTMQGITSETKESLAKQSTEDSEFLTKLISDAKAKLKNVEDRVSAAQGKASAFALKVATVSEGTDKTMQEAEALSATFKKKVSDAKKDYVERLSTERREREEQVQKTADTMADDFKKTWALMREVERVGLGPLGIIGPGFDRKIGKLNLAEEKMQRQMTDALHLEQYQDEQKLKDVASQIDKAQAEEDEIVKWRNMTENQTKAFQNSVVEDFKKLGVMVDLSELDMARAKAEEEWAVQEQMRKLKAHLGDELKNMSSVAENRLAALAARSGKQIADLMKSGKLTGADREDALAKIHEESRRRAQEIMEQDGHMRLEQDTMAQKISIASDEVEQFMGRIASLEGHGAPGGQLKKVMDKIKGLLGEANEHTEDFSQPASLTELGDNSIEKEAELRAGLATLRTADPVAMMKVAAEEADRMIDEDKVWKSQLGVLPRK